MGDISGFLFRDGGASYIIHNPKPLSTHTLTSGDLSALAALVNLVELNFEGCALMTGRSVCMGLRGYLDGSVYVRMWLHQFRVQAICFFGFHGQRISDAHIKVASGLSLNHSDIIPTLMPDSHPHLTPPYPNSLAHT